MLDVPHATTTELGETNFDLRKEAEAAGITDTLQQLEQELIGLRPVKNRERQIASLLLISGLQFIFFAMWFDMEHNRTLR